MKNCTGRNCPMQISAVDPTTCAAEGCPWRTEPTTNADRIRAMSDEELAKLLDNVRVSCGGVMGGRNCMPNCKDCWLDWLREEAAENE